MDAPTESRRPERGSLGCARSWVGTGSYYQYISASSSRPCLYRSPMRSITKPLLNLLATRAHAPAHFLSIALYPMERDGSGFQDLGHMHIEGLERVDRVRTRGSKSRGGFEPTPIRWQPEPPCRRGRRTRATRGHELPQPAECAPPLPA